MAKRTKEEQARDKLAEEFRASLADDPDLTVDDLAKANGVSHDEAVAILDEYQVADGKVEHVGPGAGRGWNKASTPE